VWITTVEHRRYGSTDAPASETSPADSFALSRQGPGFESLTEHYSDLVFRGSKARTERIRSDESQRDRSERPSRRVRSLSEHLLEGVPSSQDPIRFK